MQATAFTFAIIAFVFAVMSYAEINRLKKRLATLEAATPSPTSPTSPMSPTSPQP
ncbi:hypothetical protein [Lapillicoccus sp.]|uniref:hypothetical protein n=1 Tax=Lapillicoccus sp. TaxID=1909287 RepID=UPI0032670BCD